MQVQRKVFNSAIMDSKSSMLEIQLSPVLTRGLERDVFGSFLSSKDMSLLLVEIKLSETETQAYVVNLESMQFYVNNFFWISPQYLILKEALNEVEKSMKNLPTLSCKTILVGVWHFGHLIGDHAHRLVIASKQSNTEKYFRPIHFCIDVQSSDWIFDTLSLDREAFGQSSRPISIAGSKVRVYALDDCLCLFPAEDKSIPLSLASEHVKQNIRRSGLKESSSSKVFLTSQRADRVVNSEALCDFLSSRGWEIVNPMEMENQVVLSKVANSEKLICENGSILFNCFMARSNPYIVLCSQRSTRYLEGEAWAGGGVYNYFHKDVLSYFPCKVIFEADHPFSDTLLVDIDSLDVALYSSGFAASGVD
jgi:hypothetical protein